MLYRWMLCAGLAFLFYVPDARGQNDSTGAAPYSLIKINFEKQRLEPFYLPFDVPFVLAAPAADSLGIDSIQVSCREKGGNVIFSQTLTKDLFFRDTIYRNIQKLLSANRTYTFSFNVFRGITVKEDSALRNILRPTLQQELSALYNSTNTPDGGTQLVGILKDPTRLATLVQRMQTQIDSFYQKKNLSIRSQIDAAINFQTIRDFLIRNYTAQLTNKRTSLEYIQSYILNELDAMYESDSFQTRQLYNWELFRLLDANADTLKIGATVKMIIHNILRDPDTLRYCIHGVTAEPYKEIWNDLPIVTGNIGNYIKVSTSFRDSCALVENLLKGLFKDSANIRRFIRRLYPADITRQNAEFALISQQAENFRHFLTKIQNLNTFLIQYDSAAVVLDNTFAITTFHLRTEFLVHFHDNTVGLTSADFITRGAWYIIPDVGFAAINAAPAGSIRPYLGVNFNFFPMNRQVPYSLIHSSPHTHCILDNVARNLSITVGVTIFNGFSSKDRYADLLGTTGSLLTGAALRVSDGIRLSGGICWVYEKNSNPLSDMKTLAGLGYAALSIDLDLKKWLGGLGSTFFK